MIKVLMWGIDDQFASLMPYYEQYIQTGAMQIVGYGVALHDTHTHTRGVASL